MNFSRQIALAALIALGDASLPAQAQETVTVSKTRLLELERKAAEADKLAADLAASKAEIERLKAELGAKGPGAKSERWLPPAVEQAAQKLPPTPPLNALPPLQKEEVVSVHDLLNHYAADPAAADQRYRKRTFRLRGTIAEVDKTLFVSAYKVIFRLPGQSLRASCEVRPPDEFPRVYVTSDRERIVGEKPGRPPVTFARVGNQTTLVARCLGLRGNAVLFDNCDWPAAQ